MLEESACLHFHPLIGDLLVGRGRPGVGHAVTELAAVAVVAERGFEAQRLAHEPADGANLVDGQAALAGEILVAGVGPALLLHGAADAFELVTALEEVHGNSDGLALSGKGAGHRLPDPPGGVGGEPMPAAPVELLDSADEAQLTLLHEIVHVEPLSDEA